MEKIEKIKQIIESSMSDSLKIQLIKSVLDGFVASKVETTYDIENGEYRIKETKPFEYGTGINPELPFKSNCGGNCHCGGYEHPIKKELE